MRKLSGLLVLLFIASVSFGGAVRGLIPASFVLRSGDTMTGVLIIDTGGSSSLVLNGTQIINLDWDEMGSGQAGIEFTKTGDPAGDEWYLKLPPSVAPSGGIDSTYNWRTHDLFPVLDNFYDSGEEFFRWNTVWSYDGEFKDDLNVLDLISGGSLQIGGVLDPYVDEVGDTMTGTLYIDPNADTIGLRVTPDWGLGSVSAIDLTQSLGTFDTQDFFIKIPDVFGTPGEFDGIRSDAMWRAGFVQCGNGELQIADGVGKTAMYPGGIYAELDFTSGFPIWAGTFIDASNYSGSVGASYLFFNAGDAGGALAKDIALSFLGILTVNSIEPTADGVGNVGSTGGDAFNQMVAKDIHAEEFLQIPSEIETYTGHDGTTEIELSLQDTPSVTEETLRIGNYLNGGYVDITARGTVHINTDGPQNELALLIERNASGVYTALDQGGAFFSTNQNISELTHMTGFTVFPAFEQTDGGDDVGYYGPAGRPKFFGADVMINRIWIDLQTETNAAYVDNLSIVQRTPASMSTTPLWSQAVTLGQGNTDYISTYVDVSPPVNVSRLGLVRVSCNHLPADWLRFGRVAVQWDTELP